MSSPVGEWNAMIWPTLGAMMIGKVGARNVVHQRLVVQAIGLFGQQCQRLPVADVQAEHRELEPGPERAVAPVELERLFAERRIGDPCRR